MKLCELVDIGGIGGIVTDDVRHETRKWLAFSIVRGIATLPLDRNLVDRSKPKRRGKRAQGSYGFGLYPSEFRKYGSIPRIEFSLGQCGEIGFARNLLFEGQGDVVYGSRYLGRGRHPIAGRRQRRRVGDQRRGRPGAGGESDEQRRHDHEGQCGASSASSR